MREMVRKRLGNYYAKEAVEFLNHVIRDKPLLPFLVPLGLFAWAIERWLVPFSNWVPLAFAVWATIQVLSLLFLFFFSSVFQLLVLMCFFLSFGVER